MRSPQAGTGFIWPVTPFPGPVIIEGKEKVIGIGKINTKWEWSYG